MIDIIPFQAWHMTEFAPQNAQAYLLNTDWLSDPHAQAIESAGNAWTAIEGNKIIGFAGVLEIWSRRGMAWAYLSNSVTPKSFIVIHRAVRRFLEIAELDYDRIEAVVDCEFEEGHRWLKLLGFELEIERMRKYRPDGGDCAQYVRIH